MEQHLHSTIGRKIYVGISNLRRAVTHFFCKKYVYKKHEVEIRQEIKKDLRNIGMLSFNNNLQKFLLLVKF